jgi:aryl-alcohol dehydrogenase-like predicted oxidoreductase
MQALHDIVQAGFARYIGMSSCWAWQFQLMQRKLSGSCEDCVLTVSEYALQNRLTPFISMQNFHNALYREVSAAEREIVLLLTSYPGGTRDDAYFAAFRSG